MGLYKENRLLKKKIESEAIKSNQTVEVDTTEAIWGPANPTAVHLISRWLQYEYSLFGSILNLSLFFTTILLFTFPSHRNNTNNWG